MRFTKESLKILPTIFDQVDIFSIDNFNYKLLAQDIGTPSKTQINYDHIRTKWLFGYYGFYTNILRYVNPYDRILEFVLNNDYNQTFRQRLNIVQEMLKVNFKSNVPVHVSVTPNNLNCSMVIDYNKPETSNNFDWIIHPGQTRVQGAVFCKKNIDNVLLYIPKKYSTIKLENFNNITKIKTFDQLLQVYIPFTSKEEKEKIRVDIRCNAKANDIINGVKVHHHNQTANKHDIVPILKAFHFGITDEKENVKDSVHPSDSYINNSFESFNTFMEIIHNSKLNIYTNGEDRIIHSRFEKNANFLAAKLLGESLNGEVNYKRLCSLNDSFTLTEKNHNPHVLKLKKYFTKDYDQWFDLTEKYFKTNKFIHTKNKKTKFLPYEKPNYILIKELNPAKIVEFNQYKGFAVFVDSSIFDSIFRTYFELLFFISGEVSLSRSTDNKIAIINCEHEYWKTGENYKEWILNKEMYSE